MVELFNNKYRIKSTRLKSWDYSSEGAYYVTICTRNRQCFFGEIENETMRFSTIGEIVNSCWNEIPMHYRNVSIDKYIIMPNHLHGILIIYTVETCHGMSLRKPPEGDYYEIPLRSLLPNENEIKNLIVVGRCLSATFEAQGSARIQANCIAMGEAGGSLAAKRLKK